LLLLKKVPAADTEPDGGRKQEVNGTDERSRFTVYARWLNVSPC